MISIGSYLLPDLMPDNVQRRKCADVLLTDVGRCLVGGLVLKVEILIGQQYQILDESISKDEVGTYVHTD